MAISQMIGARIHRREDPHLITGGGRYVEDLVRPGTLTMAVVRSPHPHARVMHKVRQLVWINPVAYETGNQILVSLLNRSQGSEVSTSPRSGRE